MPDPGTELISVIVTTRNSGRTLEACLVSIRNQNYQNVELVVVDNSSDDLTALIAQRYSDLFVTKGPERSAQRNYGAGLSHGEYLLFIDSDMVLDEEVIGDGVQILKSCAVPGVIIPEVSFGDGFWTRCRTLERGCYAGDDGIEAARMYRRDDFWQAGGFDLELNGPEDWDLSRRVAQGAKYLRTSALIRHDEGWTSLRGSFVKRRYYAPGYLHYLRKHGPQVVTQGNSLFRRAFLRHWRSLVRHPVLTAGIFALKAIELIAVLQVATEQSVLRRTPDRSRKMYQCRSAGADLTSNTSALSQMRPLLITFGSVALPDGGVQTRARLTAEILSDLGIPPAIVSTREPALRQVAGWASTLNVPAKKPKKGFSLELIRLIQREAALSTVVIVTNAMFMPAITAARVRQPLIWDTNECQTLHYRRLPRTLRNRLKYVAWLGLERWAGHSCWMAIAIGEEEAATWKSTHPRLEKKLAVVDHAALASPRDSQQARKALGERLERSLDGHVLLFLGTLRAKHNAAAAVWILDVLVRTLSPDTTVLFCGPGSDELVSNDHGGATVVGLGTVEDVDSVVAAADICLAPLAAGAGVKTKVLHYLAHGKPIVGTPTAFEGVADAPGIFSASLDEIPALVNQLCHERESAAAAEDREVAQNIWMDEHHSRIHIAAQWKKVLACLPM